MNDHNHDHKGNNLPTFITGVVLGAALAYLFGTRSGKKLKDELIKESQKLLAEMGQELEEVVDTERSRSVKDKIAEGPERSRREEEDPVEKLEAVKEKIEEVKEELQGKVEDVPKHIEEIQKKGRRFFFRRPAPRAES